MAAAATMITKATWKSQPSSPPSHRRSSHSRPSTTPRALSPCTPASVGQAMAPNLSQGSTTQTVRQKKGSSPGYFGFTVNERSDPNDFNVGHHARQNWDYLCSTARDTPSLVPVEANPEFEAFRRRSEQGRFHLGHNNLSAPGKSEGHSQLSNHKPADRSSQEPPVSPRSAIEPTKVLSPALPSKKNADSRPNGQMSFFDMPRRDSPASLSPAHVGAVDHRNARLSLPGNSLHTPPPCTERKSVQRAETLPEALQQDGPNMISSQHFATLLQGLPRDVLLLDLRVAPQYAVSRIRGALNLCIPTTLTKRPSFNTQKLMDTFALKSDREKFSEWRECRYIAVYDANSHNLKDAQNPVNVLKKFIVEGWKGQAIILKGGFAEFSKTHLPMIEQGPTLSGAGPVKSPMSIFPPAQAVAPVAGGCPMPTTKSAANPFFNNIRQNMDLLDGVGQLPVNHPAEMSSKSENSLPQWLKKAVAQKDNGKLISDEFLAIERTEQKRMQDALSCSVSYGSPHLERTGKFQVAGIEKGAKNRYNNIFPYDHSRVHLQTTATNRCDYINANHIKASYSNKRYIATQAPIPATFVDFWRLVWEQDARVIVMLTAESEGGQVKSHPYWHAGDYGPLKLKVLSEKRISLELDKVKLQSGKLKRPGIGHRRSTNPLPDVEKAGVKDPLQRSPETPFAIIRHFTLSHANLPFQPLREITQLQYTQWPDFGAPAHPQHLLALIEQTSKYSRGSDTSPHIAAGAVEPSPKGQRPVLVHCSAGCGRTGTFCTVDSVVDMLRRQRIENEHDRMEVDSDDDVHAVEWVNHADVDLIAKTVNDFRGQRLSMVQSLRQFVLCYESVLDWVVGEQMPNEG